MIMMTTTTTMMRRKRRKIEEKRTQWGGGERDEWKNELNALSWLQTRKLCVKGGATEKNVETKQHENRYLEIINFCTNVKNV